MKNILPFDIDSEYIFVGSNVYISNDRSVLFEKNGHLLITSTDNVRLLMNRQLPKNIVDILKSRRFIRNKRLNNDEYNVDIKPEFFMIDMTNRCNMRCEYCLRNIDDGEQSIDYNVLNDIIDYIINYCEENKLKNVSIQAWGGEPMLEKNKVLYLSNKLKINNTKVHFSIETNATLLTEENICQLHENRIGIGVSIDGTKYTHNKHRKFISGIDSYDIVAENLLKAQKIYDNKIGTITTITKQNYEQIENIIENLVINLGIYNIKINFVHESCFRECHQLCLTTEEIADAELRILKKIVELQEQGYKVVEHNILVKLKNILLRKYSDVCLSCGCCGGKKMIVFDMSGNIFPCELTDMPEYSIGNIYNGISLVNQIKMAMASKNLFFNEKKCDECNDCYWQIFCRGGCTVRALSKNGIQNIDEIECEVNKVLYPELMKLIIEKPMVVNAMLGDEVIDA